MGAKSSGPANLEHEQHFPNMKPQNLPQKKKEDTLEKYQMHWNEGGELYLSQKKEINWKLSVEALQISNMLNIGLYLSSTKSPYLKGRRVNLRNWE